MLRDCFVVRVFGTISMAFLVGLTACSSDEERMKPEADGGPREAGKAPPVRGKDAARPVARDTGVARLDGGTKRRDASVDARVEDTSLPGVARCTGEPPVMKGLDLNTNTEFDPDLSCYDNPEGGVALPDASTDAGGAGARPATLHLAGLFPTALAGVTVDVFFRPSTLGMPAVTRVLEADAGTIAFSVPQGVTSVSARVHELSPADPNFTIAEVREYGLPIPASDEPIEGFVAFRASLSLAVSSALAAEQPDPAKALLISFARDCAGHPVSGAQFELVDGETALPVPAGKASTEVHYSYSQFAIPSTTCTFTSNQQQEALWLTVNAPVNVVSGAKTHSYRLRLKGRRRESDVVPVILREREVELFAGATTFVRVDR